MGQTIMTEDDFAHAVRLLCQQCGGSVTSWGRTPSRSESVGGFKGDPHTYWFGADVVWDITLGRDRDMERHAVAGELGLTIIHESSHDHLQPRHYPAGPLTAQQVEAWKGSST